MFSWRDALFPNWDEQQVPRGWRLVIEKYSWACLRICLQYAQFACGLRTDALYLYHCTALLIRRINFCLYFTNESAQSQITVVCANTRIIVYSSTDQVSELDRHWWNRWCVCKNCYSDPKLGNADCFNTQGNMSTFYPVDFCHIVSTSTLLNHFRLVKPIRLLRWRLNLYSFLIKLRIMQNKAHFRSILLSSH